MSLPQELGSLDYVYRGAPHVFSAGKADTDLVTLDVVYQGSPFSGNQPVGSMIQTITITAPLAGIDGLSRKFPLVRDELVFSSSESSHVFPYITPQKTSLIP